ncbi:MAG: hypothetical protein GY811_21690 [Myxococcales bacterium]|nr:hypothetical protein [Myxococcales bacterium]
MALTQILIDWEALETAVERNSPRTESFIERASGQVITISSGEPEAAQLKAKVAANIDGYVRVEPASSREQYRWMERFVGSVTEEPLQQRLLISIDGKGAFRRFKDVLLACPVERERWFSYRSNLLHWHIQTWLANNELAGVTEPPWGALGAPEELPESDTPRSAPSGAAGEVLRRQARDIVDKIAPLDLPSAIAFLEFLQARGSESIKGSPKGEESSEVAVLAGPKIVR